MRLFSGSELFVGGVAIFPGTRGFSRKTRGTGTRGKKGTGCLGTLVRIYCHTLPRDGYRIAEREIMRNCAKKVKDLAPRDLAEAVTGPIFAGKRKMI